VNFTGIWRFLLGASEMIYTLIYVRKKTRNNYAENFRSTVQNLGHAVAQLVEALRYKPEGRGFDSFPAAFWR
jgi:hypothetical protein